MLYLSSGIGLAIVHAVRRTIGRGAAEASLVRTELPWLALIILCGAGAGARRFC